MPRAPKDEVILVPWHNTTRGQWYVRVKFAGRESRHPLGTANRAEVDELIELFRINELPEILARRKPIAARPHKQHLADVVRWYITVHLRLLGRAQKTIDRYDSILHDFLTYCRARRVGTVEQLSTRIVQEWQLWQSERRRKREGENTALASRDELLCVRHFFEVAAEAGELPSAPRVTWNIPPKTKSRRFRYATDAELRTLLTALRDEAPPITGPILWTMYTGWLPSDVIDFRFSEDRDDHIDRERIKTSRRMTFPVVPQMRRVLDAARAGRKPKPADHVFLNKRGQPWTYSELEKQWRYWSGKHGIDLAFRDLRVTFCTRHAAGGTPAAHLAELATHEDVSMTNEYYVRVSMDSLAQFQAVYCDRLDKLCNGVSNRVPSTRAHPEK